MKVLKYLVCLTTLTLMLAATAASAAVRWVNVVGIATPPGSSCANPGYNSIQVAVTVAVANDTVNVCAGVYNEQVAINKALTVRGVEIGNNKASVIQPTDVTANSTSLTSGNPIAAIVLVAGAKVTLENLTVDGRDNGLAGCAPNLVGVYYRNGSGTANLMAVRNIKLGAGLGGCQSGLAIFVQADGIGGVAKVDVLNSSVHDYQKNGITANETGTEVRILNNQVSGFGPTPDIAQNGIQLGFGAKGSVETNSVINHIYSPCTSVTTCSDSSTNILLYDASNVSVKNNVLGKSQTHILLVSDAEFPADNNRIEQNTLLDADVFDGVAIVDGNKNTVKSNLIANSDESGIYLRGNNNIVDGNGINDTPCGVFKDTGTGNAINANNQFVNTTQKVCTPPPSSVVTLNGLTGQPSRVQAVR